MSVVSRVSHEFSGDRYRCEPFVQLFVTNLMGGALLFRLIYGANLIGMTRRRPLARKDISVIVDVYDTYATAPDGSLVHFDFCVPSETGLCEVEQLARKHVVGLDPEIEAERRLTKMLASDPSVLVDLRSNGFSVQPLHSLANRAA